jgi:hypothetical protein
MNKDYRWLLIGQDHPRTSQAETTTSLLPDEAEEVHLFARGQESIRITIRAGMRILHVFGPGRVQKMHEFSSVEDLKEFLESYEEGVRANGWTLLDVTDRRVANRG